MYVHILLRIRTALPARDYNIDIAIPSVRPSVSLYAFRYETA